MKKQPKEYSSQKPSALCGQLWHRLITSIKNSQNQTNRSLRIEVGPAAQGMKFDEFMKGRWREDCSWKLSVQEISPLPGCQCLAHCSPQNKVFSPSLCRSRWWSGASVRNNMQYCRITIKSLQNIYSFMKNSFENTVKICIYWGVGGAVTDHKLPISQKQSAWTSFNSLWDLGQKRNYL